MLLVQGFYWIVLYSLIESLAVESAHFRYPVATQLVSPRYLPFEVVAALVDDQSCT